MRKSELAACMLLAMTLSAPALPPVFAQGQSGQGQYIEIGYMKVQPGQEEEYLRLERELWKPIHQARVRSGLILSWKLYAVTYPGGSDSDYNYATMAEYTGWPKLESPYGGLDFVKIHPSVPLVELIKRTYAARKMVRQDVFALSDVTQGWAGVNTPFLELIYVKAPPGKETELARVEREFFKPLLEDLIKTTPVKGWCYAVLRFPYDEERTYNALSIHKLVRLEQMQDHIPAQWAEKYKEVLRNLPTLRTRSRVQLWTQLDGTALR